MGYLMKRLQVFNNLSLALAIPWQPTMMPRLLIFPHRAQFLLLIFPAEFTSERRYANNGLPLALTKALSLVKQARHAARVDTWLPAL